MFNDAFIIEVFCRAANELSSRREAGKQKGTWGLAGSPTYPQMIYIPNTDRHDWLPLLPEEQDSVGVNQPIRGQTWCEREMFMALQTKLGLIAN